MSLWADYITELRGPDFRSFLEYPDCFASYSLPAHIPHALIVHDIFVRPELRRGGRGLALLRDLEAVGRKAGRTLILAELELGTRTFDVALRAQLAAGFSPISADNGIIVMQKEIANG